MTDNSKCNTCAEHVDGCCSARRKVRGEREYKDLMNRLKRIEGQVRGVQRMLDEDVYCPDIMVQVSAIERALQSFNRVLLNEHLSTCVVNDIREGRQDAVPELIDTLGKIMK